MFIDLHKECMQLKSKNKQNRLLELEKNLGNNVYISAIGGFPIIEKNNEYYWCNNVLNNNTIKDQILNALGLSGTLTFLNSSNLSLKELGNLCNKNNHDWCFHWITLTLVFSNYGEKAELAFSRDSKFFMSWVEGGNIGKVFMASASLKSWNKFLKNKNSEDFNKEVKLALNDAFNLINNIL